LNAREIESRRKRGARVGLSGFVLALLAILSTPAVSWGHAFLTNPITLSIRDQVVTGTATVDVSQLNRPEESKERVVLTAAQKLIDIRVNGDELDITAAWTIPGAFSVDSNYVPIVFVTEPFAGEFSRIDMRWNFSSPTQQVLLQTGKTSIFSNLDERDSVSFNNSIWDSASSYFNQGLGHIFFGLDHLLFLVVLGLGLFKASLDRKSAVRAIGLVGAFTLGHAISFTLAYFGLISLSTTVVEPVIALSIFAAALGALTKWQWEKYWVLATLIGLMHGLGFASSLAHMGIGTSQHTAAIVSFNLGIDLAQICVVGLTALGLWLIRRYLGRHVELFRRFALIALAGVALFWTVTRLIAG
jgi:hydrogenase/urease accessory protein HupE